MTETPADGPDDRDLLERLIAELGDTREQLGLTREEVAEAREEANRLREQAAQARPQAGEVADPLLDTGVRRLEAQVDDDNPFGRPGQPLSRRSPFLLAFNAALGVALAYVLVRALMSARQVLLLVVVAMFLAVGLNPMVEALERRGIGRRGAIAIVFAGVIAVFVGIGFAVVPPVATQSTHLVKQVPDYLDSIQRNPTINRLDKQYHFLDQAKTYFTSRAAGSQAFGGIVGVGRVVLSATFSALTVLILTLYFTSSLPSIKHTLYRLVPRSRRARFSLLADEILSRIGGYIAGAMTIALIAGLTSFVFLQIVGVPYALALALLVAVTDLIPLIGATIGAVIITTVGFFQSVTIGLLCLAFYVIYQQVENYLIYPRIMKRTVDVPPAATIVAALIGGTLLGIVGALLAIPTAAAIQLILDEVVLPRQDQHEG